MYINSSLWGIQARGRVSGVHDCAWVIFKRLQSQFSQRFTKQLVTCSFPQTHKDLRIIYTVAEVAYRLIANKKCITSPADLKGKRIGTFPSTSAAYFVEKLLASAGLKTSDYSVVSGSVCSAAPCGAGTLPYMLQHGSIDAIGTWEPTVEHRRDWRVQSGGILK
jgi:ABC-type nitrate/sulfonate/bicarbonate transport system substrate-binding protein